MMLLNALRLARLCTLHVCDDANHCILASTLGENKVVSAKLFLMPIPEMKFNLKVYNNQQHRDHERLISTS